MRNSVPILVVSLACAAMQFAGGEAMATGQSAGASQAPGDRCERLAALAIPNATIATAKVVPAGTFVGPAQAFTGADLSAFLKSLPGFCRIVARARPTADSDIVIEVWMPLAGWNGKFQGLGNGGFAGIIDYGELGASILKGYAAAATDTGHAGSPIDAGWALGHPEKVVDFGHRGIHEMTRVAKAAAGQFYGTSVKHAYFIGCSDGGREALMEAQRYPEDYNGILAGAPANYWTALLSSAIVDTQALTASPASFIPPAKISTIAKAVVAACDQQDDVADGILNDPRQCGFDPVSIQCKAGADANDCLTTPQVTALNAIYRGLKDSQGNNIFPGYLPGAEDGQGGWGLWITGPAPARSLMAAFGIGYFPNMVYGNSGWDFKTFKLVAGLRDAKEKTAAALDAVNPDLSSFRARGGKLILYHGWNDPAIPALNTVNYYDAVVAKSGRAEAESFVRLYMLPGVQHCGGGPGPDMIGQSGDWPAVDPAHNVRLALEQWVEEGTAPDTLVAGKIAPEKMQGPPAMTRLLCPYPGAAKYKGTGDTNQAESFTCAVPAK
jgi:feruloyl esterase